MHGIATQLRSHTGAESRIGVGTRFHVYLPRHHGAGLRRRCHRRPRRAGGRRQPHPEAVLGRGARQQGQGRAGSLTGIRGRRSLGPACRKSATPGPSLPPPLQKLPASGLAVRAGIAIPRGAVAEFVGVSSFVRPGIPRAPGRAWLVHRRRIGRGCPPRASCIRWCAITSRPSVPRPPACGTGKACRGSSSTNSATSCSAGCSPFDWAQGHPERSRGMAGGCARFRCAGCGLNRLVPFSCKGTGGVSILWPFDDAQGHPEQSRGMVGAGWPSGPPIWWTMSSRRCRSASGR
jgi:hypothetical protein